MEQEKKDQRITIMLSESELESVEKWAHENRIKSRGEAMRRLLQAALETYPLLKDLSGSLNLIGDATDATPPAITALIRALQNMSATEVLTGFSEDEPRTSYHAFQGGDMEAMADIMAFAIGSASSGLSDRELAVAEWIENGSTNKEIATLLGVSDKTMAVYTDMLVKKLGANTREDIPGSASIHLHVPIERTLADGSATEKPRTRRINLGD